MVRVVTATEAKNRFGEVIKRAYLNDEHLIIQRDGIPVAAIVPMADYERLIPAEELPAEVAHTVSTAVKEELARQRLLEFLDQIHQRMPEIPEEEAELDVLEAVRAVRAG
jgi:prevent-host-death family protein